MLADLLVDAVERAALDYVHEVEALLVGEGQVVLVVGRPLPAELQNGLAVLDSTRQVLVVLLGLVNGGGVVVLDPGVHDERTTRGLVHPAEYGVGFGLKNFKLLDVLSAFVKTRHTYHLLVFRESDTRPGVDVLGHDGEVNVVLK